MTMPTITNAYGREIEIPDGNFLPILGNILANLFDLAERLYLSHQLGFPNIVATASSPELLMYPFTQYLEVLGPALSEHFSSTFHQDVASAEKHLVSLFGIGQKMEEWLREQMGDSYHPRLSRLKVSSVQSLPGVKISLPKWVQDSEYQALLEESSNIMDELIQVVERAFGELEKTRGGPGVDALSDYQEWQIRKRLFCLQIIIQEGLKSASEKAASLLPTELEREDWLSRIREQMAREAKLQGEIEFGDQRAKDIIDVAYEEPDPHRAIKLLHRALKYGDTGIQASKAYGELGRLYEDLGDITQAITYYTRAIEVGVPEAYEFFWRGQLFYQLGQWEAARHDFEQALAFEKGFFSPEREQAQCYLAEIEQILEQQGS
jgi:tetratricopeptide (TPR) repeat protein